MTRYLLLLFLFIIHYADAQSRPPADMILGKWITTEGNLIVQVYKENNEYRARVVWFDDSDNRSKPMNLRVDYKNPDIILQKRKIIGMEVLRNLSYNAKTNHWEDGMIYDCLSGREWNSTVSLLEDGMMKVRGYWHFQFIGKSMLFKKLAN